MNLIIPGIALAAVAFFAFGGSSGDIGSWEVLDPAELAKSPSVPAEVRAKIIASLSGPVSVGSKGAVIMRQRGTTNMVEVGCTVESVSGTKDANWRRGTPLFIVDTVNDEVFEVKVKGNASPSN